MVQLLSVQNSLQQCYQLNDEGGKMNTVNVACALPNGLIAEVNGTKITFSGFQSNDIIGATHGITKDVPSDFWDAWLKINSELDVVKNGHVFAQEKKKELISQIKDNKGRKTGAERLNRKELDEDDSNY